MKAEKRWSTGTRRDHFLCLESVMSAPSQSACRVFSRQYSIADRRPWPREVAARLAKVRALSAIWRTNCSCSRACRWRLLSHLSYACLPRFFFAASLAHSAHAHCSTRTRLASWTGVTKLMSNQVGITPLLAPSITLNWFLCPLPIA